MAYLKPGLETAAVADLKQRIQGISNVQSVQFISKKKALTILKTQMSRQASIFENLSENPLPDAFEIRLRA
ncbi:MAG: permease-like cell division protein FtsX, partial [Planctomycetota bacterium]